MKNCFTRLALWCSLFALWACVAEAEAATVVFEKRDVRLPVVTREQFAQYKELNPAIPSTGQQLLNLTKLVVGKAEGANSKAFVVATLDGDDEEAAEVVCGEHLYGMLFAGLQNPDLDEAVRAQVASDLDEVVPNLEKTLTRGHFRLSYTSSDSDPDAAHEATEEDVIATADVLNAAWDDYAAKFREPKHQVVDGIKVIDVKIYDLPRQGLFGVTSSFWDHIELDSVLVVADPCKRRTTPVHELFHRVQYSYGYKSGTQNLTWAVEATAAWSQKYRAKDVGDYKTRMKLGLETPDVGLLNRSYDAAHFWIYFGQRAGSELEFVRQCWEGYESKGMLGAVQSVTECKLGSDLDTCIAEWHHANARKEYAPTDPKFDYEEDEESCVCEGVTYGPLRQVVKEIHVISPANSQTESPGIVAKYGADHHRFRMEAGVTGIKLAVKPKTGDAVICGCIAVNGKNVVDEVKPKKSDGFVYQKDFSSTGATDIIVTVVGAPNGAQYSVKAERLPAPGGN